MANVFTRRTRRPRTTTLSDFASVDTQPRIFPRILSPTRCQNPHSIGLLYQSPYNKDSTTFGIWNPDFNLIRKSIPPKRKHMQLTNWTCCHDLEPSSPSGSEGKPPEIKYTFDSTSRRSFREPAYFPHLYERKQKTTRFGHTPQVMPARGIVPNVLPPLRPPSPTPTPTSK
ncbi:uncharacterized protein [Amphiura filiformis]|uniref:uncharacterized protein n=1 Tax=Amphiura filiformis TaxID=82378 RepID=UPI003B214225